MASLELPYQAGAPRIRHGMRKINLFGHQTAAGQTAAMRRRRRKFNTSIEPAVAYENESVFMSGPVQQWPAIVHRHPLGPCAKPKTSWHQMHEHPLITEVGASSRVRRALVQK